MMELKMKTKLVYIAPRVTAQEVELEQGIAAGSANINTGSDGQTPKEREYETGWSNGKDFDI
ncbi:MAG: hypothetical protein LBJ04_16210 [Sphingobacterium sp.]|jgi:hypothetical protein|nr:hypothetical protein [Sphingobacterium sp.]